MSSKLLLNRYFWDKLPSDYLDEIKGLYNVISDEVETLNEASVAHSISSLSSLFDFGVFDCFNVNNYQKSLRFSEEFCVKPISNIIKNLSRHIPEIDAAYNDEKKWFNLATKTNSPIFVFFIVDKRLEKNIFNQKLWKRFIHYLNSVKEFQKLLGVYSIYCRIFPTDYSMLNNYKKLVEKNGKVFVPWKKPFDFEIPLEKTPKKAVVVSCLSIVKCLPSSRNSCITKPTEIFGGIAFPTPIIYYIRKNANSNVLQKLQKTCKYFFHRQPTPFCHRFIFSDSFEETEFNCISMGTSLTAKPITKNLIILNALHVSQQSDKFALSKFLPNFYRLEIKFLRIHNQILTKSEFEFIVKEGNIEVMELNVVYIYDDDAILKGGEHLTKITDSASTSDDKKIMVLEDIIKLCPKIKEFFSSPTGVSPNTAQFLQSFKFENELKKFMTCEANGFFELDSYCSFVKTKLYTNGTTLISFSPKLNREEIMEFIEKFKQKFHCSTSHFTFLPIGNI